MVLGKLAKRRIQPQGRNVDKGAPEISPLGHARQVIKIKQVLSQPSPSRSQALFGYLKIKVTTQIQGEEVRVTGKSRDDFLPSL